MKIDFAVPNDGQVHRICLRCHAEDVVRERRDGRIWYTCRVCDHRDGKALYWGAGREWIAEDGELWHEVAAVLVRDPGGRVLLYERIEFPFGCLTVPAGHIDRGELPAVAAARELMEEVCVQATSLQPTLVLDVLDEACSGGADAHRWHVFTQTVPADTPISVTEEEGRHPVWLTPKEALTQNLLPHVRRVLETLDARAPRRSIRRPLRKPAFISTIFR